MIYSYFNDENREMETNQKSAQSILCKNSDSITPLSMSRRASFASFDINSVKDDESDY